ncbi:MAG: hypothetical protein RIF33_21320 [Cyclobacteriaceae bacterium]
MKTKSKTSLIIDVQFGLTNRLRALASAYNFAKRTKRSLIVIWEPDIHCDCLFEDLFLKVPFRVYRRSEISLTGYEQYNCMENDGNHPLPFIDADSTNNIYVKTYNPLNTSLVDLNAENEFLRSLIPSVSVSRIMKTIKVPFTIGVHIRQQGRKDGFKWEQPEGHWTDKAQEQLDFARAMASIHFFTDKMDELQREKPDAKFFVASDKRKVLDFLSLKYLNKVIYLERSSFDRSKASIQYALADLFLLSKSELILGSYFSSFSETAFRMGTSSILYSGIDFGSIISSKAFKSPDEIDEHLYYSARLIEYLRQNVKLGNPSGRSPSLSRERDDTQGFGNALTGGIKFILTSFLTFFERRGILVFTRTARKIGFGLIKAGRSLFYFKSD